MKILFIIIVLFYLLALLILARNWWVNKKQGDIIDNYRWNEYWSYNKMMLNFWIWDVEKMRNHENTI